MKNPKHAMTAATHGLAACATYSSAPPPPPPYGGTAYGAVSITTAGGVLNARGLGLVVTGFVAFRVLDVLKPPPIRWAEGSFTGGLGVMLDDVVAGLLAGFVTAAAASVFGGPA